jgi:hypothetical protein
MTHGEKAKCARFYSRPLLPPRADYYCHMLRLFTFPTSLHSYFLPLPPPPFTPTFPAPLHSYYCMMYIYVCVYL